MANSLQRMVAARYEEVFKSLVLPGFEKGCQEMFRQIDEAFRRGTTECEYRIAGNFRGVVFLLQADLDEILPTKTYRNAPNAVHVVKRTKFLLTKLTAVQVQRIFYPTKITRYRYYFC